HILMAGEVTNDTTMPIESSPPLEEGLNDREAIDGGDENREEDKPMDKEKTATHTTRDRQVVFIYNSHNRDSLLPHLPDVTDPDQAHHPGVNITKVSDRLAKSLEENGIGTIVDDTDIMSMLNERSWGYGESYKASKEVVEEAFAMNEQIQYVFHLH